VKRVDGETGEEIIDDDFCIITPRDSELEVLISDKTMRRCLVPPCDLEVGCEGDRVARDRFLEKMRECGGEAFEVYRFIAEGTVAKRRFEGYLPGPTVQEFFPAAYAALKRASVKETTGTVVSTSLG